MTAPNLNTEGTTHLLNREPEHGQFQRSTTIKRIFENKDLSEYHISALLYKSTHHTIFLISTCTYDSYSVFVYIHWAAQWGGEIPFKIVNNDKVRIVPKHMTWRVLTHSGEANSNGRSLADVLKHLGLAVTTDVVSHLKVAKCPCTTEERFVCLDHILILA